MKLILPSPAYEKSYLEALEEAKFETQDTQLQRPKFNQTFTEFVDALLDEIEGQNLQPGRVPATMWWLIDNDCFIGRIQIRHSLTEFLFKYGGHIGYYIRMSKRNMGYGKEILSLGLIKAKEMGFSKVLLTCDENNLSSKKIIESNGGQLENVIDNPGHPPKRRYWIHL